MDGSTEIPQWTPLPEFNLIAEVQLTGLKEEEEAESRQVGEKQPSPLQQSEFQPNRHRTGATVDRRS